MNQGCDEWKESGNGNWVLLDNGNLVATVYAAGDSWGAIWNGAGDGKARRLKAKLNSAADACQAIQTAIAEGERSAKWWPPEGEWLPRKAGGYYRKLAGSVVSVKQARSKSWYAARSGALLGKAGRGSWFATAKEALQAVEEFLAGRGGWSWVEPQ